MEIRLVEMIETGGGVNILIGRCMGHDNITWWCGTQRRQIQLGKGTTRDEVLKAFREATLDQLWSAPHFYSVLGGD